MPGTIAVYGYIARGRHRVRRFDAEGDSVRGGWVGIGPLHCFSGVDEGFFLIEAHHNDVFAAPWSRRNHSSACTHVISRRLLAMGTKVNAGKQLFPFLLRLPIVEGLVVRKRLR